MQNVTLKQLRALAAIVRNGRVGAAAEELNLTSPAVTSQLKLMEEALGVALFDRTRDGMRPTAAGREVYKTATHVRALLEECGDVIRSLKGLRSGHVTVGVVSTAKYFAPSILAAFMRKNPAIEIKLTIGNRGDILQALSNYAIDLAIMGQIPAASALHATGFGDHPLIVIAPPDHPLAGRTGVAKQALAGERFLLREEGSGTRASFELFFTDLAYGEAPVGIEFGSNETIKQAVMAGLGLALISGHTVAAEVSEERLASLHIEGLPIKRRWFVAHRSDRTLSVAGGAFAEFLVREGGNFLPPDSLFDQPIGPRRGFAFEASGTGEKAHDFSVDEMQDRGPAPRPVGSPLATFAAKSGST